jgi:alanine dehydrogenase
VPVSATVVIIGAGGVTGRNALTIALGMGAHVIALGPLYRRA